MPMPADEDDVGTGKRARTVDRNGVLADTWLAGVAGKGNLMHGCPFFA
ncbi:hypothetical protein NKJ52_29665 [Mesorhizobium australicum]